MKKVKRKYVLTNYPYNFWHVGELDLYENGIKVKQWVINKFYEVDGNFFTIFEVVGGSGTGYCKGNVTDKIDIRDSEFETTESFPKYDIELKY